MEVNISLDDVRSAVLDGPLFYQVRPLVLVGSVDPRGEGYFVAMQKTFYGHNAGSAAIAEEAWESYAAFRDAHPLQVESAAAALTFRSSRWMRSAFDRAINSIAYNWDIEQARALRDALKHPNFEIRSQLDRELNVWVSQLVSGKRTETVYCPNVRRRHVFDAARGKFFDFYFDELGPVRSTEMETWFDVYRSTRRSENQDTVGPVSPGAVDA